MRTKPLGSKCKRKRRKNSSTDKVNHRSGSCTDGCSHPGIPNNAPDRRSEVRSAQKTLGTSLAAAAFYLVIAGEKRIGSRPSGLFGFGEPTVDGIPFRYDGADFCRGYIQHWLKTEKEIPNQSAVRIFAAATSILKAGTAEAGGQ